MSRTKPKDLTIFGVTKRLDEIVALRHDLIAYFNDLNRSQSYMSAPSEGEKARAVRPEINRRLDSVVEYIEAAGVPCVLYHSPAPAIGGFAGNIHVLHNIFNWHQLDIRPVQILDIFERAIGVYQAQVGPAKVRTFNPIFWLLRFLRAISSLPFSLLDNVGLGGHKLEESFVGKLIKLLTELITLACSAYGFLKLIGREDMIRKFFE
ncbi:hypothetical protein GC207_11345 [bacterium]|nr:hypothetical protein [bacterium]